LLVSDRGSFPLKLVVSTNFAVVLLLTSVIHLNGLALWIFALGKRLDITISGVAY